MQPLLELTEQDRALHEWQIWVEDFGEIGQQKLKSATALVSRCGGLGSVVAYELAAAGIGKLILAHAGNIKPSDLNRQLLMSHRALGTSRVLAAQQRLLEFKPQVDVETVAENINEDNAEQWVAQADIVIDCAPTFQERFALNRQAVALGKPLVECAMYDLEAQLTTIVAGQTPCLQCLYPDRPPAWKREFPVFGAVSGMVGCLGAMEAIKVLAGFGNTLSGKLLVCDLRAMTFRTMRLARDPQCEICSHLGSGVG